MTRERQRWTVTDANQRDSRKGGLGGSMEGRVITSLFPQ